MIWPKNIAIIFIRHFTQAYLKVIYPKLHNSVRFWSTQSDSEDTSDGTD